MKCWYCKTYLGEPHYHGQPAPVLLRCNNCPTEVEYRFGGKSEVYRTTFSCSHNDKKYTVCIEPDEEMKFVLYNEQGNLWFPVVKSTSIPNINPTNVEEKVRTYLVFS